MNGHDDLAVDTGHAPGAHRRPEARLIEELRAAPVREDATELAAVIDVLHALSVEPLSSEQDAAGAMAAQMAAALRQTQEQPRAATPARRHRAQVAAVLVVVSMAASTGLAAADMLPDPVQRLASDALEWFGISVPRPGSGGQSGVEPDTRTSRPVDVGGPTRPDPAPEVTAPIGSADGSDTPERTTRTSTSAPGDGSDAPVGTDTVTDPGSTGFADGGSANPDHPVGTDPSPTIHPTDDAGDPAGSTSPDTTRPDDTTPWHDVDPAPPADSQPFPTSDAGTPHEPAAEPTGPGTSDEPTPQPTDPGTGDGAGTGTGYRPTAETTASPEPLTGPRS